ncbi:MAG: FtsX-like permease family protein [Planctomycetes bacterium]|nr:FtsX-like permease family protein [Planctomycetota bacterium]
MARLLLPVLCLAVCRAAGAGQSEGDRVYRELKALAEKAPGRQVGQAGNRVIDDMVRSRFEEAALKNNPANRWAEAQKKLAEAEAAQAELARVQQEKQLAEALQTDLKTAWYVKYTVESPGLPMLGLVLVLLMLGMAWIMQKRRSLLAAGGVLLGIMALLPVADVLVETKTEAARKAAGAGKGGLAEAAEANAARKALEADLAASESLKGLWLAGRMKFTTAAFVPGQCTLKAESGRTARLYQMAPNMVEPANLPAEGYSGNLVYVGTALPSDLAGKKLTGAAAVVEFDCSNRWLDAVQLGAEAIIVLEPKRSGHGTYGQAAEKVTATPLSVPRFYATRDAMRQALGKDWEKVLEGSPKAEITQEPGVWKAVEAANDWLYIPGKADVEGADKPLSEDAGRQVVHIQAYKDSLSAVPELSPGANGASNVLMLLRLAEQFGKEPPERPVLLSVVNDHTNGLYGEQVYAHNVFGDPTAILEEIDQLDKELAQHRYTASVYSQKPSHALLQKLRTQMETVGGRSFTVKEPAQDRLKHLKNICLEERNDINFRLEEIRKSGKENGATEEASAEMEKLQAEMRSVEERAEDLIAVMCLLNKIGRKTYLDDGTLTAEEKKSALTERQEGILRELFLHLEASARTEAEHLERTRREICGNASIRRRLMFLTGSMERPGKDAEVEEVLRRRLMPLPAVTLIAMDLTYGNNETGFFYMGHLPMWGRFREQARQRVSRLARHTLLVGNQYARTTGKANLLKDTIRNSGGVPWDGYVGGQLPFGGIIPHQYKIAGLTLTTIHDMRPAAFTPFDTAERIDRKHFGEVADFVLGYLPMLVNSQDLGNTLSDRGEARTLTIEVTVRKQDKFSVKVPKNKVAGALVVAPVPGAQPSTNSSLTSDARPWVVLPTDVRGTVRLRGDFMNRTSLLAFEYDPEFRRVQGALDFGMGEKRFASTMNIAHGTQFESRNVVAFWARKVDLVGLSDPLSLRPASDIDVIDARQDSLPQHFSTAGLAAVSISKYVPTSRDGTGCVFMESGATFKLKIGTGLAVNSTEEDPQGSGFSMDVGALKNLVLTSATDMWRLTDARLTLLNQKGVVNDTAEAFNEAAMDQMKSLEEARAASRTDEILMAAEEARGLAYRAYVRGRGTISDLIKAVVIFLALVIPFCFFVMKLVTPYTDLNRQMVLFGGIFLVMVILLQFVHPAFEVAQMPQVVILAFIILGLAIFVSGILVGRFNSSMNQAVEEVLMADSIDAPQSRLAGVAFMVGVNNMKRRRIRTTLTTATIILVTFTMLSVISVGQDVEPVQLKLGGETPYDGFVYANPGLGPIDPVQMHRIRAHFEGRAAKASRAWVERKDTHGVYLPYAVTPVIPIRGASVKSLSAKVLLGLEVAENGFLGPMAVKGRWFSANDVPEMVLSEKAAGLLGITPGNLSEKKVWLNGVQLEVVGLIDDKSLEDMKDIAGVPVLPLLVEAGREKHLQGMAMRSEAAKSGLLQAGDFANIPGTRVARPEDIAIVPLGYARMLGNAQFRTLSVKYDREEGATPEEISQKVWDDANKLIRFQDVRLSVGLKTAVTAGKTETRLDAGQYALASSSSAEVGGVLKVAIPIILGATIILNTMLGSVMERKREIGIYNAIGLNPTHVMVFFLAESLVFGLVGSVAGYLIGQMLSLVVSRVVDLNLNYSSLSVMLVIFLTITTVLLSTIYPAMMAARAAVPSGQRRWSLPQPEGDQIRVNFPFVYDASRVVGACAYLYDFMKQNSEASVGKFLAAIGPVGRVPAEAVPGAEEQSDTAYAMLFDVAPAPFDLGVNQKMEVYACFDERVHAHMLTVHLTRMSGQKSNWVTVNQPFLETLRKRLLSWRSQKLETQEAYRKQGEELFRHAIDLPVKDGV